MGSQLKVESDSHRETRANLETTIKQLAETRQEIEKTRDECHDFMKKFKDEENARNKYLAFRFFLFKIFYLFWKISPSLEQKYLKPSRLC